MKQIKFIGVALAAVLMLLTSCLGDTSNSGELHNIPGRVRYTQDGKMLIDTYTGALYSSQLSSLEYYGGEWMYISFAWDRDSPDNADADTRGYLHVTLLHNPVMIDEGTVEYYSDTTQVMNEEIALTNAAYNMGNPQFSGYIEGDFMITSEYKALTDQRMRFHLYCDSNQEPYVSEGRNTYTFYIRGQKYGTEGKTPTATHYMPYYYKTRGTINTINSRERSAGNTSYNIAFRYISEIDEETGELTWETGTNMIYFDVTE